MNEQQLRCFKATAEQKSMTKAAAQLSLSVPSVKRSLDSLESDLGHTLLERTNRGIVLTEAGKEFLSFTTQVLSMLSEERKKLEEIDSRQRKIIRVGYDNVFVRDMVFMDACATYLEQHPYIQIQPLESPRFDTERFDLFFGDGYDETLDIKAHFLGWLPITCIMKQSDPRAQLEKVPLSALDLRSTLFPPVQMLKYTEPSLAEALGPSAAYQELRSYTPPASSVILAGKVIVYLGFELQNTQVCQRPLQGFRFRYRCYSYRIEEKPHVSQFVKALQEYYRKRLDG